MSDCINKKRINVRMKNGEIRTIYADCNKCIECQNKKKRANIKLFSKEFKEYKYCIFLTLTYDSKNIQIIDFYESLERDIYNLSKQNKDFYREFINKYNSINDYYHLILDTIHNYEAEKSINYNFYKNRELEKKRLQHSLLCDKYSTLKYAHVLEYLNEIRKKKRTIERRKENKDKKIKIAYIGCGEYPNIKLNRGRAHYHIILATDELEIIETSLRAWKYGNIAVERGENQLKYNLNEQLDIKLFIHNLNELTLTEKLNCIITQETKDKDVERIMNYIKNNELIITSKNRERAIAYTIAYTHKKNEAEAYSSNFNITKELAIYYKIKKENKDYNYKDIRMKIREQKAEYRKNRRNINYIFDFKEEAFIFKSKNAAMKDFEENFDKYKNEQLDRYYDINNNYKKILIDDITHNRIIRKLLKNTNRLEKELKDEKTTFERKREINYLLANDELYKNEKREYDKYIKKRNIILNKIKLFEAERERDRNKDFNYKVKEYSDKSIDIIELNKNKNYEETYKLEYNKQEYIKLKLKMKEFREYQKAKEFKSDILIDKVANNINQKLNTKSNEFLYTQYVLNII